MQTPNIVSCKGHGRTSADVRAIQKCQSRDQLVKHITSNLKHRFFNKPVGPKLINGPLINAHAAERLKLDEQIKMYKLLLMS